MSLPVLCAAGALLLLAACENRVNTTRQCLGGGNVTSTYTDYTFNIEQGPAVEVAGNCHVVLDHCTIHAPEGIRATENATVTVVGGTLIARGAAVTASGNAKVSFEGTAVTGTIDRSGAALVTGLAR